MKNNVFGRFAKNTGYTLIIPVGTLIIMLLICALKGVPFLAAQGGFRAFVYTVVVSAFSAYALGIHMFAGRFDFSLGSVATLSAIIGGKIAISVSTNMIGMLFIFIVTGAVLGIVSGLLYICFNLPPIITSLGAALAFEGLSFGLSGGRGVQISLFPALLGGSGIGVMIFILIAGIAVLYVLFNHTLFGFNYRAIQFGQKIAVDTGLNEKRNAIACYILSGALVSMVGFLRLSFNGTQIPQLSLSSSGSLFSAMLPLFVGGLMQKRCEQNIAIFLGCLTTAFITQGMSAVGVSLQARSLITSFLMIAILMYSTNGARMKEWFTKQFAVKEKSIN